MYRKYGFHNSLRKAHFLGQIFKETGALRATVENGDPPYFTRMYENYTSADAAYEFDHKHAWLAGLGFLKNRDRPAYIAQRPGEVQDKVVAGENVQPGDGPRFCGRGLIHLTWRRGYREYGEYRAKDFTTDPNPLLVQSDAETVADSAGYFWVKTRIDRKADHGASNEDVRACFGLVGGAGGLAARQQFFRYAYFILNDAPTMPVENGLVRQTEG
jgi:predicted chitinase